MSIFDQSCGRCKLRACGAARLCGVALSATVLLCGWHSAAADESLFTANATGLAGPEYQLVANGQKPAAAKQPEKSLLLPPPAAPPAAGLKSTSPTPRGTPTSDFAMDGATRGLGGAGAPTSTSTYMIGDFFSSSGQIIVRQNDSQTFPGFTVLAAEIPTAGGSRRVKISDNNTPIPTDRVFFVFNEFVNAIPLFELNQFSVMDVDRYMPGFEKTFWQGMASVDVRTPVAYTQNANIFLDGSGPRKRTEFGNISVALKFLLLQTDNFALAAGTGINLPTAAKTELFNSGQQILTIQNQSVHLLPYVGGLWAPSERTYVLSFMQVDVDPCGNRVNLGDGSRAGVLNDQTLLYFDISAGYWLYNDPTAQFVTGIIPTLEFHYTTTLQNADILEFRQNGDAFTLGNTFNRLDIPNMTVGSHFRLGPLAFFTIAGVFPLSSRDDQRQFDSEIIAQFNQLF